MFFKYQSRAEEISGTFRWIESKGGASYDVCAAAGVAKTNSAKKINHEGIREHEDHEAFDGFVPFVAAAGPSWLVIEQV
jgi:hypothetical protein